MPIRCRCRLQYVSANVGEIYCWNGHRQRAGGSHGRRDNNVGAGIDWRLKTSHCSEYGSSDHLHNNLCWRPLRATRSFFISTLRNFATAGCQTGRRAGSQAYEFEEGRAQPHRFGRRSSVSEAARKVIEALARVFSNRLKAGCFHNPHRSFIFEDHAKLTDLCVFGNYRNRSAVGRYERSITAAFSPTPSVCIYKASRGERASRT